MVTMTKGVPVFTADEYFWMPDDGRRTELIRGVVVESPHRSMRHGELVASIGVQMLKLVEDKNTGTVLICGGVVVTRNPDSVIGSDVSVYAGRTKTLDELSEGYGEDVPTVLLDVVDRWDAADRWFDRVCLCREAGIAATVSVWPRRRMVTVFAAGGEIRELRDGDALDLTTHVDGLLLAVSDLFD